MADPPEVLRPALGKGRGQESLFARLYLRRLSYPITRLLLRTRVTPTQVTIAFIALMMIGAAAQLEQRARWVPIVGAALLQLGLVLDAVDGEIARAKQIFRVRGVYLDMVGHRLVHGLLFLSIGFGLFRRDGSVVPLILGAAGSYGELALTLILYAKWRALLDYPELMRAELSRIESTPAVDRKQLKAGFAQTADRSSWLGRAYHIWFGSDYVGGLLLATLVLAIADREIVLLWFYGVVQIVRATVAFLARVWSFTPELGEP